MLNVQTQLSHSKDGSVEITPQIVCKKACWNHIIVYIYFAVPGARGTATNLTYGASEAHGVGYTDS